MEKKKEFHPLHDYLIVKGIKKETKIIVAEPNKKPQIMIEKFVVHAIGDDVEKIKVGDEVLFPSSILNSIDKRFHNKEEDPEDKYLWVILTERDIQAIIK